jgi:hypothetical protein
MRSKNSKAMTARERVHIGRVKELPCSVCDTEAPSQGHHIKQDQHFTVVALCPSCHGGPGYPSGWHGTRALWRIKKMDELDALAVTIERLMA